MISAAPALARNRYIVLPDHMQQSYLVRTDSHEKFRENKETSADSSQDHAIQLEVLVQFKALNPKSTSAGKTIFQISSFFTSEIDIRRPTSNPVVPL